MTTDITLPVDEEIAAVVVVAADEDAQDAASEQFHAMWREDARRTLAGMLRAARRMHAELDEDDKYLAMLKAEVARKNAGKARALDFLEWSIRDLAEDLLVPGSQHVDVPLVGRVQYRNLPRQTRIEDPEAFMAALGPEESAALIELRPHLKTVEAKKYADAVTAEHGEVMPGVERIPPRRTSTITFEGLYRVMPENADPDLTPALEASIAAVSA